MKKNDKKAISLVEILISALLLSLVAGGLFAAFLGVRRYVRHAKERSTAMELSASYSRSLHRDVRADSWDTGNLSDGVNRSLPLVIGEWADIDGINYETRNTGYVVRNVAGHDYREVGITVEYPD